MSKRVTIVVEDDLIKKLRIYQAKLIKDSEKISVYQESLTT